MAIESTSPIATRRNPSVDEEIDLREVLRVLWNGKLTVIGVVFFTACVSVALALWLPNVYRADALLVAHEESANDLSGLASQYGGLASLAGISLPSGGSMEKTVGLETLRSRKFIVDFIERHDLLVELMAVRSFDVINETYSYKSRIYDIDTGSWIRKPRALRQSKPSPQEAYEEFLEIFSVSEDEDTGFVSVSIEHYSPKAASLWVAMLIEDLNFQMMEQATDEAQGAIDYLTTQLGETQIVALQDVFYSLIEEQTKTIMLAKVRPEYLFKVVDPPVPPEEKVAPRRGIILLAGSLLGILIGCSCVLATHYLRNSSK